MRHDGGRYQRTHSLQSYIFRLPPIDPKFRFIWIAGHLLEMQFMRWVPKLTSIDADDAELLLSQLFPVMVEKQI